MRLKKHFKNRIRIFLENDADVYKIVIRLSKTQLLRILDMLLPDEPDAK
jgi:hypothetical protein